MATAQANKWTIVEQDVTVGGYEMLVHDAVIERDDGLRVYIRQGYCGEGTIAGGAMRYSGGYAVELLPGDGLAEGRLVNRRHGYDPDEPRRRVLPWEPQALNVVACAARLEGSGWRSRNEQNRGAALRREANKRARRNKGD